MTINLQGELLDLTTPKVMGILNCTPDSFSDGGKYMTEKNLLLQTEKMLSEGASIIDVGGASSKPNAAVVSIAEESNRIKKAISAIKKYFPNAKISIDTFHSEVASIAISEGACMVNDISAGQIDHQMMPFIANSKIPYLIMHSRGTPQNMQLQTHYDNILLDIFQFLNQKINLAHSLGIIDVIVDIGIGFAKKNEQNFHLLKNLSYFKNLNKAILIGISRKSLIYNTLGVLPQDSIHGTTALNMVALQNGANLLRVHDVKEAMQTIALFVELNKILKE